MMDNEEITKGKGITQHPSYQLSSANGAARGANPGLDILLLLRVPSQTQHKSNTIDSPFMMSAHRQQALSGCPSELDRAQWLTVPFL